MKTNNNKATKDSKPLTVRLGMFRAITTRYIGPTNVRGSRVKAHDGEGNSVTIAYDYALQRSEVYAEAARKLCEKMHWSGELVGGGTKDGYVFVFVEPTPTTAESEVQP